MRKWLIKGLIVLSICLFVSGISSNMYAQEISAEQVKTEEPTTEQVEIEESTTEQVEIEEITEETTTHPESSGNTTQNKAKWVKFKKGYKYRYSNGEYAKHGIIIVKKSKYYIDKKGYRTKGVIKYKGHRYYFSKKSGKMYTGKKIITYKKNKYYVVKGEVVSGLKKIGKNQYYFSKKNGKMIKNKLIKVKGTYYLFSKNGKGAKKNVAQVYAIRLINRLCNPKDSKQEKLRKGFLYMANNYHYAIKPGFVAPESSTWVQDFAYNIYTTHSGRCYSFAAAFGVYAKEVGYKVRVINASTRGISGGYVPHAWVEVVQGGHTYVYDPELAYQTRNISSYYKRTYASVGGRYRK